MAEYICFEASASDESDGGEILTEAADIEMIDDTEQENNDASFFSFVIKQAIQIKLWKKFLSSKRANCII